MQLLSLSNLYWGYSDNPRLPLPVGRGRWLSWTANPFVPLTAAPPPPPADRRTPNAFLAKLVEAKEPDPFGARLVLSSLTPVPYNARVYVWPALNPTPSPTPTPPTPTPTPTSPSSFSFIYW